MGIRGMWIDSWINENRGVCLYNQNVGISRCIRGCILVYSELDGWNLSCVSGI